MHIKKLAEILEEEYIPNKGIISIGSSKEGIRLFKEIVLRCEEKNKEIILIPTSIEQSIVAREYDIKIMDFNDVLPDLGIEFSNEIDFYKNFNKLETKSLIKDRILAYFSKKLIIYSEERPKERIGKEILVEVSHFGWKKTKSILSTYGDVEFYKKSEGGHYLFKVKLYETMSYTDIENIINVPGVIEHSLFINYADVVFFKEKNKLVMMK